MWHVHFAAQPHLLQQGSRVMPSTSLWNKACECVSVTSLFPKGTLRSNYNLLVYIWTANEDPGTLLLAPHKEIVTTVMCLFQRRRIETQHRQNSCRIPNQIHGRSWGKSVPVSKSQIHLQDQQDQRISVIMNSRVKVCENNRSDIWSSL